MPRLDGDGLDDIASAFARLDSYSHVHGHGHGSRVTGHVDDVAARPGLRAERRRWIRRA